MSDLALIRDLAIIWTIALISGHICIWLKQPIIAGYMLAGVIVGPYGLKWINQSEQIRVLAEFGVAMLLFTLGVDLSLRQVISSARSILSAGIVQLVLTLATGWGVACLTGVAKSPGEGFLFGAICAMSSSVVISRTLMDRGELDSIHGQILVPLSLVQDLSLVAIISFLPLLHETPGTHWPVILQSGMKAIAFILAVVVGATRIMPWLLSKSARADSKEIFLLTVLVLCLGIALLSQFLGLSIALGAFLAGLMMSESVYANQALHELSSLRDIFSTVFFVSIGMLLDPTFVLQSWLTVGIFVFLLILGKALIGSAAALLATNNLRSAILVGTGLSQIGEFSLVLLTLGCGYKLVSDANYNLFLAGAVISMVASPGIMSLVPKLMRNPIREDSNIPSNSVQHTNLLNHVVVCGFGRVGRNLGHVLEAFQLPFVVIELNAVIIDELAKRGIPHIYGDAMNELVLIRAQLKQASVLVLTMADPFSAKTIAAFARATNPAIKIVARGHRLDDISIFRSAGVNAVVQPEFEASIEITRLVLHGLHRPANEVHKALDAIRMRRYSIFQPDIDDSEPGALFELGDDQIGSWFRVVCENSMCGKSISDLKVRSQTGASIIAVRRKDSTVAFPDANLELEMSDEIYAVGNSEQLSQLEKRFGLLEMRCVGMQ